MKQHKIKTIIVISLLSSFTIFVAGCQISRETTLGTWLEPNNPTLVSFPLIAASQTYSFSADPGFSTQVTLSTITPDLPYTAELREVGGKLVASLLGSSLRNALLTIAPGQGSYEISIKSEKQDMIGMLSVQIIRSTSNTIAATDFKSDSAAAPMTTVYQPIVYNPSLPINSCSVRSSVANNVNIRSGPGTSYTVIGTLAKNTTIPVSGQTSTGWFQVNNDVGGGWVSASVTTFEGQCAGLPQVMPPDNQLVSPKAGVFNLEVDRDGWGNISNHLNYSDLNRHHLILLAVTNMMSNAPDNYREFTLTLLCNGTNTESIRWGAPENPTLACGSSTVLPMTTAYNQQWIAVTLPESTGLSDVYYTMMASRRV